MSNSIEKTLYIEFEHLFNNMMATNSKLLIWLDKNKGDVFVYENCFFTVNDYIKELQELSIDAK